MDNNIHNRCLVIGTRLQRLIKESDCRTQEKFAYEFGVDVRTVGRWIHLGIDSLTTIYEIATFFKIDPMELLK